MREFFQPLIIFVVGNVAVLFLFLFYPEIGDLETQLVSDTAGWSGWGWSWVSSGVRFLVFAIAEGVILFAVGKSILGLRNK